MAVASHRAADPGHAPGGGRRTATAPASQPAARGDLRRPPRPAPARGSDPLPSRGPRFLPLTDAYLLHNGEPPFEHVVSVVIVNTAHITQLVPLVTLA